jgi:uncharacterized protein related to proFAR isomerase
MSRDKWSRMADILAGKYVDRKISSRECYIPAVDTYMKSENGSKLRSFVEKTGRKRYISL